MSRNSHFLLSTLRLTFPPMSNQVAFLLRDNPIAERYLRESNIYAIAGRQKAEFSNFALDANVLSFQISMAGSAPDAVRLHLHRLEGVRARQHWLLDVDADESIINILARPTENVEPTVVEWFTTEKLLFNRWQRHPAIEGLDRVRSFTTYELLYVGIATKDDTFVRLIQNGHKARTDILANEPQRSPGARVTDEIYLFPFRIEPTNIATFELDPGIAENYIDTDLRHEQIVADAEKAFVRLLNPQYNIIKFKHYPKGADGLYQAGLKRYAFQIGESITFLTPHGTIHGHFSQSGMENGGDFIYVEGDNVVLSTDEGAHKR